MRVCVRLGYFCVVYVFHRGKVRAFDDMRSRPDRPGPGSQIGENRRISACTRCKHVRDDEFWKIKNIPISGLAGLVARSLLRGREAREFDGSQF